MLKPFFLFILAAGVAASVEVGLAVDSSGEVLLFLSFCTGLKLDISIEADLVVGHWFNLEDILGSTYALGLGGDVVDIGQEAGLRERGANGELIFSEANEFIGGTLSIGCGKGMIKNARSR